MKFLIQDTDVKFGEGKFILYFYNSRTPYHTIMMKFLNQAPNIDVIAIDTDYFEGLCRRFEVKVVPTLIFLQDGKALHKIIGLPQISQFFDICRSIGDEHGQEDCQTCS